MTEKRVVQPQIGGHRSAEIAGQQDCTQHGTLRDKKDRRAKNEDCTERRSKFYRPGGACEGLNYLRRSDEFADRVE